MREMGQKISNYRLVLPRLRNSVAGFTLIEILVVVFIFMVIVGALVLTLNTGQNSSALGSARADLQAKIRTIMASITRDVRQTSLVEINSNSPSVDHLQFRKISGIDASGNYTYDTYDIEYAYDSTAEELTRTGYDTLGNPIQVTWQNITESPFYVSAGTALAANNILTSKKLFVVIAGETTVLGRVVSFSLSEEVKIRNE